MAKLSFSTRPKKKYYSYTSDGHIYDISTVRPTVVADGGGFWSCYFECEPYYKNMDGNTFLMYEKIGDTYVALTASSVYKSGNVYYCYLNGTSSSPVQITTDAIGNDAIIEPKNYARVYYTKNGKTSYTMPYPISELPQVEYNGTVYYFDTLIDDGDTYNISEGTFTPMDTTSGEGETTYGDVLLNMIKNTISLNAFNKGVSEIPAYLTGGNLYKKYEIESIGYSIPAFYFITFGKLFMEMLNNLMVKTGQAIVDKYKSSSLPQFVDVTINSEISSGGVTNVTTGTITTTPKVNPTAMIEVDIDEGSVIVG